ncbi:MAG: prepilin-type N-terminal cleavage/methylation domain-containing protein, partial [Patescibacteria group bacterium]
MIKHSVNKRGFSLIEILVYIAVLGIIIATVASFLSDVLKTNSKSSAKQAVSNNITLVSNTISNEIRFAKNIYTPTSFLNSDSGQLSLETELNPPVN